MKQLIIFCLFATYVASANGQVVVKSSKITGKSFKYTKPVKMFASGTLPPTYVVFTKGLIDEKIRINISIKDQWVSELATLNLLYSDDSKVEIKVDSVIVENALFPQSEGVFIGSYIMTEIKKIRAFKISDPKFKFDRSVFIPTGKAKKMWENLQEINKGD